MLDFNLISLGILQFIIITFICYYEAKKKSPAVFLWATLEVMFGVMHLVTVCSSYFKYSYTAILEASVFVIIFGLMYLATRIITTTNTISFQYFKAVDKTSNKYKNILIAILFSSSIFMMYHVISFSGGLFNTSWGSLRAYSGTLDYANSSQILSILYFSSSGIFLVSIHDKNTRNTVLCSMCILFLTIITRNRILILPLFIGLISSKLMRLKSIKLKNIITAALVAIIVIYLVYGIRVFRHYGTIGTFIEQFEVVDFIERINNYLVTDNGELGLRNDFYYFIEYDNNFYGFGVGATYLRMLLVYLPTQFSFGFKPSDFAITMGHAVGMPAGGSTHPTLFGDCYANFGFIGVFLGIFWGCYVSIIDFILLKIKRKILRILLYSLFSITFVIIGRGSVYNSFFLVAWGVPILFFVDSIIKKSIRYKVKFKGYI